MCHVKLIKILNKKKTPNFRCTFSTIIFSFFKEPTWDTSSAFFARAAGRNPASAPVSNPTTVKANTSVNNGQNSQTVKNGSSQPPPGEQIDPVVYRSRQVAGWCACGCVNQASF